jgi:hypothetical protein
VRRPNEGPVAVRPWPGLPAPWVSVPKLYAGAFVEAHCLLSAARMASKGLLCPCQGLVLALISTLL